MSNSNHNKVIKSRQSSASATMNSSSFHNKFDEFNEKSHKHMNHKGLRRQGEHHNLLRTDSYGWLSIGESSGNIAPKTQLECSYQIESADGARRTFSSLKRWKSSSTLTMSKRGSSLASQDTQLDGEYLYFSSSDDDDDDDIFSRSCDVLPIPEKDTFSKLASRSNTSDTIMSQGPDEESLSSSNLDIKQSSTSLGNSTKSFDGDVPKLRRGGVLRASDITKVGTIKSSNSDSIVELDRLTISNEKKITDSKARKLLGESFDEEASMSKSLLKVPSNISESSIHSASSWESFVEVMKAEFIKHPRLFAGNRTTILRIVNNPSKGFLVEEMDSSTDPPSWELKWMFSSIDGCTYMGNGVTFFYPNFEKLTYYAQDHDTAMLWCHKMNLCAGLNNSRIFTNFWLDKQASWNFGMGDVVLFKIKHAKAMLQRIVTNSDWDHVGIVVPLHWGASYYYEDTGAEEKWALLEATPTGVCSAPLTGRLNQYFKEQSVRIRVRHLYNDEPRRSKPEEEQIAHDLRHFFSVCDGQKYSRQKVWKNISAQVGFVYDRHREEEEAVQGYFCSELVARALSSMKLLDPKVQFDPCAYWPRNFSYGGFIDQHLIAGYRLSGEIPVEHVRGMKRAYT